VTVSGDCISNCIRRSAPDVHTKQSTVDFCAERMSKESTLDCSTEFQSKEVNLDASAEFLPK